VNPEHWESWYFRGCAFSAMELFEKAIPDLKLALSLDTTETETRKRLNHAYLGRAYQHLDAGEYLEAIDDFTNATESKDFIAQAYEGRSIAFTNLGKIYEAKADIAKAKFFQEEQKHSKKNSHG